MDLRWLCVFFPPHFIAFAFQWKDPRGAVPATSPHGTTAAAKAAQEKRDKIQRISQSIQRKHRSAAAAPDVVDGVVATVVGANPAASDFKAEVVAVRQLKTLGILTVPLFVQCVCDLT